MDFLTDKRGNLSVIRVSLVFAFIGAIFLIGGFLSFTIDQESRRSPFFPELPPGAQQWGVPDPLGVTSQRVFYRVDGGDMDAIVAFYNERIASHYGISVGEPGGERCHRFPPVGDFPDHEPGDGTVPFYYTCMFDRGGLNMQQFTQVTIQPGASDTDPFRDSEGAVVIIYEQRWQR